MAERVFRDTDFGEGSESGCGCPACRRARVFGEHLLRSRPARWGFSQVRLQGHELIGTPGDVMVPHFMLCEADGCLLDRVVVEAMTPSQFAAWTPDAAAVLDPIRDAVPELLRLRRRLRQDARGVLPARPTAALAAGRYPSFRYFLEFWPDLVAAGVC